MSKVESLEEKSKVFVYRIYGIRYNLFRLDIKTEKDALDHYLQEGYIILKRINNPKEISKFNFESFNEKVN